MGVPEPGMQCPGTMPRYAELTTEFAHDPCIDEAIEAAGEAMMSAAAAALALKFGGVPGW